MIAWHFRCKQTTLIMSPTLADNTWATISIFNKHSKGENWKFWTPFNTPLVQFPTRTIGSILFGTLLAILENQTVQWEITMRKEVDYRVPAQQPCFQFNFTLSEPQFNWVSDDCMSGSRLDKGWGHSCPRGKFSPYCPLFHRLGHSNIGTIWGSWAWWFWLNGDSINKENKLLFAIPIYEHCHSSLYLKVSPEEHFYLNKYNLPCFQQSWNRVMSGGGWSTWYRPGLFSFFWIWQSNFSANWPPVLFSLTISPYLIFVTGATGGDRVSFFGRCKCLQI